MHETRRPATGAERTAIIVAGMHRSGTSATTRIVNLLGAQIARVLIPADIGNERGHWESRAVQDLHNGLLAELGSDLYSPVGFPAEWFGGAAARPWIARIRELLADEYPTSSVFVLKDPRIALFLPLWTEALRESSIVPRFVLPFRHPHAVATSLEVRELRLGSGNALPHAQGIAVWLRHVLAAEKFTRGQRRTFVEFDQLLADWRAEFARMGSQLGIDWPNWQRAEGEIDDFLETGSRGQAAGRLASDVADIFADVYSSLAKAVREPQSVFPAFDTAGQGMATAETLLGPHIVARQRVFDELRQRADLAAQQHDIDRAEMHGRFATEIGLRDSRIAEAVGHARRMEETVAALQLERDRATENALTQERGRKDMHARLVAEIELRDARIAEAAVHAGRMDETVDLLRRQHLEASDYAVSLAQDRDRAIAYAQSLRESRDEAIEYAQALEHARDEAGRQRRSALLAHQGIPVFFTIASRNHLAYASTLMQSIAAHYPDAPRYLILADRENGDDDPVDAPFVTIAAEALALPDFDAFAFRYTAMERNRVIKPYAFADLRRRHPAAGIICLDSDIPVLEPLTEVEVALADGAFAAPAPHRVDRVDDEP
jgi:hypothetical protein